MKTISLTKFNFFLNLQSSLRSEDVKFQYRMGAQKGGPYLYEIRILSDADEGKVNAAMAKHQAWVKEYENRKELDGWIDG